MQELVKIREAAKKYDISARTLRYYEEIGLLESVRDKDSNYRLYDPFNMKKLEQILLFRNMQFSLQDIEVLLERKDSLKIMEIFSSKLKAVNSSIDEFKNFKEILNSVIKISNEMGIENVNFYNLLKEQIYIHGKNERMVYMETDIIMVEFGVGIIPMVDEKQNGKVIDGIKAMRTKIKETMDKEIPLIRLRDNEDMEAYQYRILIKDRIVFDGYLSKVQDKSGDEEIVKDIENIIMKNIENI